MADEKLGDCLIIQIIEQFQRMLRPGKIWHSINIRISIVNVWNSVMHEMLNGGFV